jgi:hypothetical protein
VDGFAEGVGRVISGDYVQDMETLDDWYKSNRTDRGMSLQWGAHLVADGVVDESRLDFIKEHHRGVLVDPSSMGTDLVIECVKAGADRRSAKDAVEEEVEMFLLRRVLPGSCAVCPGLVGAVNDGRRRKRKSA